MAITNKTKTIQKKRINTIIKKWTQMLRSGDYKKTTGRLHIVDGDKHSYCCLGVLCELALQEGVLSKKSVKHQKSTNYSVDYGRGNDIVASLPLKVQKWAGLQSDLGVFVVKKDGLSDSLASLNDSGTSFKQIAKIIESKPEGLFVQ